MTSKSQKKRDMLALQQLGARAMHLNPNQWRDLGLSPEVMAALEESLRIKGGGAIKRHERRLGKLLSREQNLEPLKRFLKGLDMGHALEVRRLHLLEAWRDRLLSEGDVALSDLSDRFPVGDKQQLRQLIDSAKLDFGNARGATARRQLFAYLDGLIPKNPEEPAQS